MKTEKPILVTQPFLPPLDEFNEYLKEIWDNKWLTNDGKFHQMLEKELCGYLGVKYISLFANGTLALITALQTLNIMGEVITTPFSFVATAHSLWWNNIKPVFVDIESGTFNIDADKIEAAITPKTTAILPVNVFGNPCDDKKIQAIADKYGLKVIYDSAHAFGVSQNNQSILNFGDLSILSFHATKVFNTFEGGAIICKDEKTKKRIDNLKNFGYVDGNVIAPGINGKMNEVQASMGLLQLKYIDGIILNRKKIADKYRDGLRNITGLSFIDDIKGVKHNYSYFPILINAAEYGITRDELFEKLAKSNIIGRRYFYPLISQFSTYKGLESAQPGRMPVAERITEEVLCLPIYPDLEDEIVEIIINLLKTK